METQHEGSDAGTGLDSIDRDTAALVRAAGILFGFIPTSVIWLIKKDEVSYLAEEAKKVLYFQIFIALCFLVSCILIMAFIGVLLIWLVWIADITLCIIAAVRTLRSGFYHYPISLRLIE